MGSKRENGKERKMEEKEKFYDYIFKRNNKEN